MLRCVDCPGGELELLARDPQGLHELAPRFQPLLRALYLPLVSDEKTENDRSRGREGQPARRRVRAERPRRACRVGGKSRQHTRGKTFARVCRPQRCPQAPLEIAMVPLLAHVSVPSPLASERLSGSSFP